MPLIKLSKSIVGKEESDAVSKVLINDGYLGMGSEVAKFEAEIGKYLGIESDQVVCVSSGTAALHLAVEAIISAEKNEIIVPSFTFLSSFQAISGARAIPVSCEIYEDTWTIDLEKAEKLVNERTCAIMPVHYASNPVNLEKLYAFAEKHKIRVIEDAAHAFGCSRNGIKIGATGDIVCFSFDGIKNITSGEGGAIITRDPKVLSTIKDTRLLGIEKDTEMRFAGKRSWDFEVTRQGYRYHMSNIFAAIGRVQLSKLENEFKPKRKRFLSLYEKLLSTSDKIIMQRIESGNDIIPHICPVRILNGKRDALREYLNKKDIQTGIHYKPNHLLAIYKKEGEVFPITMKIYEDIISLPLHPELSENDIKIICNEILNFLKK